MIEFAPGGNNYLPYGTAAHYPHPVRCLESRHSPEVPIPSILHQIMTHALEARLRLEGHLQ